MNNLLIYDDSISDALVTAFRKDLGPAVSFKIIGQELLNNNFSIDKKIHAFILDKDEIEQKKYDAIFIPYSLSEENYLEFLGIRLAYHIRLTKEFKNLQVPIILFGPEDSFQINKLSTLGQILFTKNILHIKDSSIENFNTQLKNLKAIEINEEEDEIFLKNFLSKIHIPPPINYQSHHSVDNELALLQWSKYLSCDHEIPEVKNNISTGLFFKYYIGLNPVENEERGNSFYINILGSAKKIILIDDEADKGWLKFYENLLKINITTNKTITLKNLNIEFKNLTQEDIIAKAKNFLFEEKPDLVILDLRLCDEDFNQGIIHEELTGIKILEYIKSLNKGIQVIITTASNKIWNYENSSNANGYILKQGSYDVKNTIKKLRQNIEKSITDASFLINYYNKYKIIKEKLEERKNKDLPKDFVREYLRWLLFGIEILQQNNVAKEEKNIVSFIFFFSVLENIANRVIDTDTPEITSEKKYKYKFRADNKYLKIFEVTAKKYSKTNMDIVSDRNLPWNQKILNTLDYYGCNTQNINNLIQKRNDIIHQNTTTGNNKVTVSDLEIKVLFDLVTNRIEFIP
jgi:CheY-like chemotaxis protein